MKTFVRMLLVIVSIIAAKAQEQKAEVDFASLDLNFKTSVEAYKAVYAKAEETLNALQGTNASPDMKSKLEAAGKAFEDSIEAFIPVKYARAAVSKFSSPQNALTPDQLTRAQQIGNEYLIIAKQLDDKLWLWHINVHRLLFVDER